MDMPVLTRRHFVGGSALTLLGGCSALSTLNTASEPLATYDLHPAAGAKTGGRTSRTLLIARPQAPAALASDRILIRPDPVSIAYLPDARWTDELPLVVQSLLVRSISDTGRIGYVGRSDAGPVPDKALLVRIDAFEVKALADDQFEVAVEVDLTILRDRDQRVIATRGFAQSAQTGDISPKAVVTVFQALLDDLLPTMSDWTIQRV